MKRRKNLFIGLILAFMLFSCEKEQNLNIDNKVAQFISINKNNDTTQIIRYNYDKHGRIKEIMEDKHGILVRYTYFNSSSIKQEYFHDNKYDSDSLVLDNDGYVKYRFQSSSIDTFYYKDGFLVTGIQEIIVENENIISITKDDKKMVTYNYLTDKLNTLGRENFGDSFWGKSSKNLVSSATYYKTNNDIDYTLSYIYEFDNYNRAIKRKIIDSKNEIDNTDIINYEE